MHLAQYDHKILQSTPRFYYTFSRASTSCSLEKGMYRSRYSTDQLYGCVGFRIFLYFAILAASEVLPRDDNPATLAPRANRVAHSIVAKSYRVKGTSHKTAVSSHVCHFLQKILVDIMLQVRYS